MPLLHNALHFTTTRHDTYKKYKLNLFKCLYHHQHHHLSPYTSREPIGVFYKGSTFFLPFIREGLTFLVFFNFCLIFIGVSTNNRPNYLTLRVFFGFLTLFALNVSTIYTSKLITVFTGSIRAHQMDTIEEILYEELPIGTF